MTWTGCQVLAVEKRPYFHPKTFTNCILIIVIEPQGVSLRSILTFFFDCNLSLVFHMSSLPYLFNETTNYFFFRPVSLFFHFGKTDKSHIFPNGEARSALKFFFVQVKTGWPVELCSKIDPGRPHIWVLELLAHYADDVWEMRNFQTHYCKEFHNQKIS